MIRFNQIRYWLLGLVVALCIVSRPALAQLSPSSFVSSSRSSSSLFSSLPSSLSSSHPLISSSLFSSINPSSAPITQSAASFAQQAQSAYEQGRYQAAVTLLQQAYQQHQRQGDVRLAAVALSNLSLTYQQLGNWQAAADAITQARQLLSDQPSSHPSPSISVQAQILDVQGQLYFARGDLDRALEIWQQTAALYAQIGDIQRQALSRLHQAQTLQAKGLYLQVAHTLEGLAEDMREHPDLVTRATVLRQLGDSLRATGNLDQAHDRLQDSLAIAKQLRSEPLMAAVTLSLGNLEQGWFKVKFEKQQPREAIAHAERALDYYKQVAQLDQGELGISARLNLMRLITNPILARWDLAIAFYPTIQELLPQLPSGRPTVLAYVGLAENLITLRQNGQTKPAWAEIANLLTPAYQQAQALGDWRSQSLVLGTLGHLYEQNQQWSEAENLSRRALSLAEFIYADDIRYRWEWQLGRILKAEAKEQEAIAAYTAEAKEQEAIAAYTNAFETLKVIRSDLVTANPDVQFSFRESVEPIYRQLVDLLLVSVPQLSDIASPNASTADDQARLKLAREVMESLQVAQLENFFQSACVDKTIGIDEILDREDRTAAVVYAILLDQRLEVVLKLPQQENLVHFAAPVSSKNVNATLATYRNSLMRGNDVASNGRQLYDWLLKPAADADLLNPDEIKTLIFVLDGNLRLIPMATLHDGDDFLVKKYAISLVLGLAVRDPETLPPRKQMQVLAASLENPPADADSFYTRLPGVTEEVAQIKTTGMRVTTLQEAGFTRNALNRELSNTDYTIVHLATHGQFGSDRQNTYILAADGRINIDMLGQIFQSRRQANTRLEMLILSACKTATGDSREVLGIAGAMVQSGARSSIATLWSVDDRASILFSENFYAQLAREGVSRAEALRRAQVALLERYPGRPRYWAPYVLVGSWR